MADRFWVGNAGNWSDTNHWSTSSGGAGGASVPTSSDNVYFNANSFNINAQIVNINTSSNCNNLNCTGLNKTIKFGFSFPLNVCGSFILSSNVTTQGSQPLNFIGNSVNNIQTFGVSLTPNISFSSTMAVWILQDNLTTTSNINLSTGGLNFNNKSVSCARFLCNGIAETTLGLGSSVLTCSDNVLFTNTSLILLDHTSTIKMTGSNKVFSGGDNTFYNIEINDNTTIYDDNIFNEIKVSPGKTLSFEADTIQTVSNLDIIGEPASLITLTSNSSGNQATINSSNEQITRYCDIQDLIATGNDFYALNSTDSGNNSGWVFNKFNNESNISIDFNLNTETALIKSFSQKNIDIDFSFNNETAFLKYFPQDNISISLDINGISYQKSGYLEIYYDLYYVCSLGCTYNQKTEDSEFDEPSKNILIPIYEFDSSLESPHLRINTNKGVGYIRLVNTSDDNASYIRIFDSDSQIKSLRL